MFHYLSDLADIYNNNSWRNNRAKKREADRVTVLKLVAHPRSWEAIREEYWLLAGYPDLDHDDRLLVRQLFSRNRRIAGHHLELSPDEWDDFIEGRLVPSAAHRLIKSRLTAPVSGVV